MSPNPISLAVAVVLAGLGVLLIGLARLVVPGALLIALAVVVLAALKMAQQWEQAVVLRAGKFLAVRGPGLFWIIPVLDHVAALIDTRLLLPRRPGIRRPRQRTAPGGFIERHRATGGQVSGKAIQARADRPHRRRLRSRGVFNQPVQHGIVGGHQLPGLSTDRQQHALRIVHRPPQH